MAGSSAEGQTPTKKGVVSQYKVKAADILPNHAEGGPSQTENMFRLSRSWQMSLRRMIRPCLSAAWHCENVCLLASRFFVCDDYY